jgi:LTXXQ motif family protein
MPLPIRRIGRTLTTAVIVGTAFILPSAAIAQASPAPTAKTMSTKQSTPGNNTVEARIKSLHDALKITPAEEAQWQAVADVMRDNAKTTGALIEERTANAKAMTAIDDLHSYEAIAEAHVAGVKKLIPAVDALYANMSDTQKKNADAVFSHRVQRAAKKSS